MSKIEIKSKKIKATVNYHGAELKSLVKVHDDCTETEYLWQADPKYWNRTSPVLFPFVGAVNEGVFRYKGKEYKMGQHGFARDMEFTLLEEEENCCKFVLKSDEATKEKYPFDFELMIGYRVIDSGIEVMWEVLNTGGENLEFSIGAHPAFNCILNDTSIRLSKQGNVINEFTNSVFGKGLLTDEKEVLHLENGIMPLNEHSFDGDAYVIEDSQADKVEILDKDGKTVLAVAFDSPLVGIWSPPGKNAPFLCIEPWYGRADKEGFTGELSQREWNNTLSSGERFSCKYIIEI